MVIPMQVVLKMGLQLSVNGFLSAACPHSGLANDNSVLGLKKGADGVESKRRTKSVLKYLLMGRFYEILFKIGCE